MTQVFSRAALEELPRSEQVRAGFIEVQPFYGVPTADIVKVLDEAGAIQEFLDGYELIDPADFQRMLSQSRLSRHAILALYREAKEFLREAP